jgi:hypothetical protein
MRNLLFVFAFILSVGAVNAQKTCTKSQAAACAKSGIKCLVIEDTSETSVASAMAAADLAAQNDDAIEKRVCSKSGTVSFFKTSTCSKSGKVSKEEVLYDVQNSSFVNVAPSDMISDQNAEIIKVSDKSTEKVKACSKSGKKCCASKKKEGA